MTQQFHFKVDPEKNYTSGNMYKQHVQESVNYKSKNIKQHKMPIMRKIDKQIWFIQVMKY